jgi:hypothetical protein
MASSNNVISNIDVNMGFIKVILIDMIFQQLQEFLDVADTNNLFNMPKKY